MSTFEAAAGVTASDDPRALALYAWNARVSAGKLAEIEGLADVAVEHGEDRAARAAEEGFGEDGGCTHFGVICARKGYGGEREFGAAPRFPGPQGRGTGGTGQLPFWS